MPGATDHLTSGGRSILIEAFSPTTPTDHPAVLVLHGTFGLEPPYGDDIRSFAEALMARGIAAIIPHYFEGKVGLEKIAPNLQLWKDTCNDALTFLAHRSGVDSTRLGAIGFSLGAHITLNMAMHPPPTLDFKCVVDFFGPTIMPPLVGTWAAMPPLLIHHGDADTLVVPENSAYLMKELKAAGKIKGKDYDYIAYAGQGHGFTGSALVASRDATVKFVETNLAAPHTS
jgi:dienelactone hydrolase